MPSKLNRTKESWKNGYLRQLVIIWQAFDHLHQIGADSQKWREISVSTNRKMNEPGSMQHAVLCTKSEWLISEQGLQVANTIALASHNYVLYNNLGSSIDTRFSRNLAPIKYSLMHNVYRSWEFDFYFSKHIRQIGVIWSKWGNHAHLEQSTSNIGKHHHRRAKMRHWSISKFIQVINWLRYM